MLLGIKQKLNCKSLWLFSVETQRRQDTMIKEVGNFPLFRWYINFCLKKDNF